jgi:hypothetical protein
MRSQFAVLNSVSGLVRRWILPAAGLLLVACGIGPNEKSGGDSGRGDAKEVALDALMYDRVSAEEGDSTDWKSFKLEEDSPVLIKVWWDDPKGIGATVELRDMEAKELGKLKHEKGAAAEKLGPIKLKEGTYYVRFNASSGGSVYSYQFVLGTGDPKDVLPDL